MIASSEIAVAAPAKEVAGGGWKCWVTGVEYDGYHCIALVSPLARE